MNTLFDKRQLINNKLWNNPEVLHQWRQGRQPGPLSIEVGCVRGCNQRCVHCGFQQYDEYGDKILYLEDRHVFNRFLQDFAFLGGQDVFFAGNGEPLINPELGGWALYGRELGLNMLLSTNGVLLDDRRRDAILRGMKWIKFSVGGGDPDTYARVHGCRRDEFQRLSHNISEAVNFRDRNNLDCQLWILYIIYDLNWQSMDAMVQLMHDTGADRLIMRKASLDAGMNQDQPWDSIIKELQNYRDLDNVEIRWDTFIDPSQSVGWQQCYGIHFRTNMDHHGNLYTCARNFYQNSVYGNILEARFRDIWFSQKKQQIFAEVERGLEKEMCCRMCQAAQDNRLLDALMKGKLDVPIND